MPNISDFCGYCGKLLGGHCCEKMTPTKAVIDPWVKVGTTTIDGDRPQVASALGLEVLGLDAVLGYIITDRRVLHVGGRNIIPVQWECNDYGGMVHCDIVRRQSEIEAERWVASARKAEPHEMITPPTCPECGPHGNRGEVLLASSWAKCTTCAGGKPGDLWGEVKSESFLGVKSYTLAIGDLVLDGDVEVKRGSHGAMSAALIADGAPSYEAIKEWCDRVSVAMPPIPITITAL